MSRITSHARSLAVLAVVGSLVGVALWPRPLEVEVATVSRGPLAVTIDDEGRTRVRNRFTVAAPVAGHVLRIDLEPGDRVAQGEIIARVRPEHSGLLDARTRADATAAVTAAEAAAERARAEEQRAQASLAYARRELTRTQELAAAGAAASQDVDARAAEVELAVQTADAAAHAVQAAASEADRARSRLSPPSDARDGATVAVRSPVTGVVLQRLHDSEGVIGAGTPLLVIGDPRDLEVVTDLLSTDAVRVQPGATATLEGWGGESRVAARVRRVEPSGFTKVSTLGVEEQRVNVVLELVNLADAASLGDGYRVDVRIVLWQAQDVLKVPTSALFRAGAQWAAYAVSGGRAVRTGVRIGHQTSTEAEVLAGLDDNAAVIVHPGDLVQDGGRVRARTD